MSLLKTAIVAAAVSITFCASSAEAGGRLTFDKTAGTAVLEAHLVFFSKKGQVSEKEASLVARSIESLWSGLPAHPEDRRIIPPLTIMGRGYRYRLITKITHEITSLKDAKKRAEKTEDYTQIFVRIDSKIVSRAPVMGSNVMAVSREEIGDLTTAAHEFGHLLGLDHRGHPTQSGEPSIMYNRGMAAHIQDKHRYVPGDKFGALNPVHRRVLPDDVAALQWGDYVPESGSGPLYICDLYSIRWKKDREARYYLRQIWK